MKRILSCLMALLLIAALLPVRPAAVYAAGKSAASVQTASYSYEFSVPSEYTIRTNTDETQFFGNLSVSLVNSDVIDVVEVYPTYSELVNVGDSSNTLPFTLYENSTNALKKTGSILCLYWNGHAASNGFDKNGFATRSLSVKVTDWSKARINERYKAKVYFEGYIKLRDGTEVTNIKLPECTLELVVQPMTYNVTILGDKQLDPTVTTAQELGSITVSSVSSDAEEMFIAPAYTTLVNVENASDKIAMKLVTDRYGELNENGNSVQYKTPLQVYSKGGSAFDSAVNKGSISHKISAVVSDWSKATPGATYKAEIIYKVSGKNTSGQSYEETVSRKTTITAVIPVTNTIDTVNLTGYRYPTADQTSYVYSAGLGMSDSHLRIKATRWFCVTDGKYLSNTDKFEAGKKYQLKVEVEAEANYVFTKDLKFTVYGQAEYVAEDDCTVERDTNPQTAVLWTKEYTIKAEDGKFENINLTGYKLPIVGQLVKDYDFENLILNDVHLKITRAQWVDKDNKKVLSQNDKFEGGINYALEILILADKGYIPQVKSMKYYVNSKEEDADYKSNSIKEGTLGYEIDFWVVPIKLTAPVSKNITTINVIGYTDPVAGTTAGDYKYSDLKPELAANYTVTSAEWYDESTGKYLEKTDKFQAGNKYSMKLTIKADSGYTIADKDTLKVKINGDEKLADSKFITVNNVGTIYTAEYWTASYTIPMPKTYSITVINKGNGTVSSSAENIEAGKKVIVTAAPGSDKVRFKEWIVISGSLAAGDIKQVAAGSNQYEFTMPAADVQLQAVFEDIPEEKPVKTSKRLGGDTRYETANLICKEGWTKSAAVVIASGADYPDALAGTVLAGKYNAPILLTAKNSITEATLKQIKELGATSAYILGGKAAVSENVEKALKDNGLTVTRVAGATRNSTAAEIAYKVNSTADTVYLVSNKNFADALSVSAGAAIQKYPILYLNPDGSIPAETKEALTKLKTKNAVIIGGPAAINGSANDKIRALGIGVTRVYGSDRYETSIKVYDSMKSVFTSKDASVATGKTFPDALAGAAFAASRKMPVLLVGNTASQDLIDRTKDAGTVYIFGGTAAVSEAVENQLKK